MYVRARTVVHVYEYRGTSHALHTPIHFSREGNTMNAETFFERVVVHTVGQVVVHSIKKIITYFKFTPSEAALSRFAERPGERVSAFFVTMKMSPPPSVLRIRFTHGVEANESGRADLILAIPARKASSWPRTCPSKSPGTNVCPNERHNHKKSPFKCCIPTTHA